MKPSKLKEEQIISENDEKKEKLGVEKILHHNRHVEEASNTTDSFLDKKNQEKRPENSYLFKSENNK